ncbi:MAG: hypothetical protein ABFS23_08620, partial [Pseudomonadota bacterium]
MTFNGPAMSEQPFFYALLIAISLHGIAILGLGFIEPPEPLAPSEHILEITVVRSSDSEEPEEADFLAESNQQGSGNLDKVEKPTVSPAVESPVDIQTTLENITEPLPFEEAADPEPMIPDPVVAVQQTATESAPQEVPGEDRPEPVPDAVDILANLNQEILDLTAELDRKTQHYANKPRRKTINAATREHQYAAYLETWRR